MVHTGFSTTLARYVGRAFTLTTILTLCALTGLISLFDFIDLLRRAAAHPEAGIQPVLHIAALHIPYYSLYILPFAILLGGMICFSRLARSSELVVTRAAGLSVWQLLLSPSLCAALLGAFMSAALSPLSSASYRHAVALEAQWLQGPNPQPRTLFTDLWLRSSDNIPGLGGDIIFHIGTLHQQNTVLIAQQLTIFRLDRAMNLLERIEAPEGTLSHGYWNIHNALTLSNTRMPHTPHDLTLPSDFTPKILNRQAIPADTLSLWALPHIIKLLHHSGFSTIPYQLHFQGLLALPMLAVTMVLVAAGFSMRPAGRGGIARMLGIGVTAGFTLFAVSKIAEQLGKSGALPPLPAAWAPAGIGLCLAAALLLHLEDG